MRGTFLDTNVFLRHLLNDDPIRSAACHDLFRAVERRELTTWTSSLVVAEIVFVLSNPKTYDVDRQTLRNVVLPLLRLPNLKLERKQLYTRVFDLFVTHPVDYVDAFHAALLENAGQNTLFSYDLDFDYVADLSRQEP